MNGVAEIPICCVTDRRKMLDVLGVRLRFFACLFLAYRNFCLAMASQKL